MSRKPRKKKRKSCRKNPDGLPKGAYSAPDGGFYCRGPRVPVGGGRGIYVIGKRRKDVDMAKLTAALSELAELMNDDSKPKR